MPEILSAEVILENIKSEYSCTSVFVLGSSSHVAKISYFAFVVSVHSKFVCILFNGACCKMLVGILLVLSIETPD